MSLGNQTENSEVANFTVKHVFRKTDQDVDTIKFRSGTMFFLPNGIGNFFKNLKTLQVECGLSNKIIGRSNLQNLQNLEELNFNNNEIEILDEKALWDLPALEIFQLKNNKVKELHEGTFDSNRNLRIVLLQSNQLETIPRNLFSNNNLLEKVDLSQNYLKIIEIDFTLFNNVRYIDLRHNVCINAFYQHQTLSRTQNIVAFLKHQLFSRIRKVKREFNNLEAFQNKIRSDCI